MVTFGAGADRDKISRMTRGDNDKPRITWQQIVISIFKSHCESLMSFDPNNKPKSHVIIFFAIINTRDSWRQSLRGKAMYERVMERMTDKMKAVLCVWFDNKKYKNCKHTNNINCSNNIHDKSKRRYQEDTKKIPMTKITRRRQRDILSDQVHLQETHLVFSHVFAFCVFRVSCFLRRYLFPSTLRVVTEEEKGSMSRGRRMVQKSWEGSRGRLWQQRRRTTDNSHEKEHLSQDSILMVSIQRERTTNKRKRVRW